MAARSTAVERAVAKGTLPPADAVLARDLGGIAPAESAASTLAKHGHRRRASAAAPASCCGSWSRRTATARRCWSSSRTSTGPTLSETRAARRSRGRIATLPVLLALSTRVDGDPTDPAWRARARGCPVTTLDLAPLADDEARELAARYAGLRSERRGRVPREGRRAIRCFSTSCCARRQSGQTSLPGSVRGLLLARHRPAAAGPAARRCRQPRFSARASAARRFATCSRSPATTRRRSSRRVCVAARRRRVPLHARADPRRGLRIAAALDAPSSCIGVRRPGSRRAIRRCRRITSPQPTIPRAAAAYLRAATLEQRASRSSGRSLMRAQPRAGPHARRPLRGLRDDRRDLPRRAAGPMTRSPRSAKASISPRRPRSGRGPG